jgi:hypothetical protein
MKRDRGYAAVAFVLAVGLSSRGCECAEREPYDTMEPTSVTSLETTTAEAMTTTGSASSSGTTDDMEDVSRFLGAFHYEVNVVAFGFEVPLYGDPPPSMLNVEIFADGTASMTMESCTGSFETIEIAWTWDLGPGPSLELAPGLGETSLRYASLTDAKSIRVTPLDECDLVFEIDGHIVWQDGYYPGKACWVKRCEEAGEHVRYHIDYCEGEEPPPCE